MAERLVVRGVVDVKIRHPWGAFFLGLITFGIYYVVWYYKINRELRDYGRAMAAADRLKVDPLMAVIAITIGGLIIVPPFVSWYRTFTRIETAEELAGIPERVSPGLGFVLFLIALVLLPFEVVYAQRHLNTLWRHAQTA